MIKQRCIVFLLLLGLVLGAGPGAIPVRGQAPASPRLADQPQASQAPAGVPEDWWSSVQEGIRGSEYQVTWQEETHLAGLGAAYQAPNRAQNLRSYFTASGVHIIPRTEEKPSWQWSLRLSGYGREGALAAMAEVEPLVAGNRVEYRRGELSEWYVNDERGLEQGFTLAAPPVGGRGLLVLELALGGDLVPRLVEDGAAVDFLSAGGVRALRYGELRAVDARGQELPARLELASPQALRLVVDDSEAVYPVTIDPLASSPGWSVEGDQTGGGFGIAVDTAGDVNGDGYADVIIGAFNYDHGETDEGAVFVYHGSVNGLSPSADWWAESNGLGAYFGYAVGTAGDVNGDGYADIIVGALHYENGERYEGAAYVWYGSAAGLGAGGNPGNVDWYVEGNQAYARLGYAVGTAGDVNDDGYDDVIVGIQNMGTGLGAASVYYGSPTGLPPTADWQVESNQFEGFGMAVSTAGDVNGDSYDDVIIGAPNYYNGETALGAAYVYLGSAGGLATSAAWAATGDQAESNFGMTVSTVGDVNGDGYDDIIIGAPMYDYDASQAGEGAAFLWYGGPDGMGPNGSPANADWRALGDQAYGALGLSVDTAGDVNGDGYDDALVGASGMNAAPDVPVTDPGRALVYLGSAAGLGTSAGYTLEGDQPGAGLGYAASTAGDVNGDGYDDIIVGAPVYDGQAVDTGQVLVYYGSASGSPALTPAWSVEGDQAGANLGVAVSTAGDVNGDGYTDVIVGASGYDNGEMDAGRAYAYYGSANGLSHSASWTADSNVRAAFGHAVSTAGDVNGDGYADVIIGAPACGSYAEGRAFVYYGSANGLAPTAGWTVDGAEVMGNLGMTVGTAGDVNGDGYDDIIVGESADRAYVYYGSANGLSPAPSWTAQGDQARSLFGHMVGTAGDVNGDGYDDVVIGAPMYNNGLGREGRSYLYLGSANGLASTPSWTATIEQADAIFGYPVGTAGDVNGDGYSDVFVGAPYYDNGETDEGRVYVYYGSASGLSATANWVTEGNKPGAAYGLAGTAGDMNGDGYADLIVGAPEPPPFPPIEPMTAGVGIAAYDATLAEAYDGDYLGRTYVYYGSASGLSTTAAWINDGTQPSAMFGFSVSTAGDVNGDGYADVIVGAMSYDGQAADTGQAIVYHGSGTGTGKADLALSLAADPDPVYTGAPLTYTLSVRNAGPSPAREVVVTANLPAGAAFVSASGTGWTCEEASGVVTCRRAGTLLGTAPAVTIVVTAPGASGTIHCTALASTASEDMNPGNNAASAQTTIVKPLADLAIGMTATPEPVYAAAPLTYTLSVTNAGPGVAEGVVVSATLLASATFVSASGESWTCEEASGVVTCRQAELPVGPAPQITIVVTTPAEGGTLNAMAQASAATADPDASNNAATAETAVTALADVVLEMTATPEPVYAAAPLTYTLNVTNAGPSTAEGVVVSATLPTGASLVSASGEGWTCEEAGGVLACWRATLPVGAAPAITVVVTAPAEGGTILCYAEVDALTGGPGAANDKASVQTAVIAQADLGLSVDNSPVVIYPATTLTYTLEVANAGPSTATGLVVTDTLPVEVTFVSATGEGWQCTASGGVVTCRRASLVPGLVARITIVVTIPAKRDLVFDKSTGVAVIRNEVTVTAAEADPDLSNNLAQLNTSIKRNAH